MTLGFLRRGPISPRVHGTLDYLLAIGTNLSTGIIRIPPPLVHGVADIGATVVLVVAPFVLGFSDQTVPTVLYVAIGAGGLCAALLTRFESDLQPASGSVSSTPSLRALLTLGDTG
jgi:hypothetical protein